jgi:hypothetical protein
MGNGEWRMGGMEMNQSANFPTNKPLEESEEMRKKKMGEKYVKSAQFIVIVKCMKSLQIPS